jgi:hypothetical protein
MLIERIRECFGYGKVYYSMHARAEMENEEFGEIQDHEVYEAVLSGKVIESYPKDFPYPSCLIYGHTRKRRPIHLVCAYSESEGLGVIITVYEPDPEKWFDFTRRKQ